MNWLQALQDPIRINTSLWSLTMTLRGNKNKNGDIYTCVNELTDEIQEWCAKNANNYYAEWDGDYRKEFKTWLSNKTKLIITDPDNTVVLDATRGYLLKKPSSSR